MVQLMKRIPGRAHLMRCCPKPAPGDARPVQGKRLTRLKMTHIQVRWLPDFCDGWFVGRFSSVALSTRKPVVERFCCTNYDAFLSHVGLQCIPAILLSIATCAPSTPARARIILMMFIDPNDTSVNEASDSMSAPHIRSPDSGTERKFGVVHQFNGFRIVAKGRHAHHWTKNFLSE